jgi:hypothetical protein
MTMALFSELEVKVQYKFIAYCKQIKIFYFFPQGLIFEGAMKTAIT